MGAGEQRADDTHGAAAQRWRAAWHPCLFLCLRDCTQLLVEQRAAAIRDVHREIAKYKARVGRSSGAVEHTSSCIDKNRTPDARGGSQVGGLTTYTRPYSTYSSLLYLSSTGFTPRDHIDDGIECFGATGRSSRATE